MVKILSPPPTAHSSELAAIDFHFVLHMKSELGGQNFNDNDKLKESVNTWLHHMRHLSMIEQYKN